MNFDSAIPVRAMFSLGNIASASIVVCLFVILISRCVRKRSLPFRQSILLCATWCCLVCPIVVVVAQQNGWGLLPIDSADEPAQDLIDVLPVRAQFHSANEAQTAQNFEYAFNNTADSPTPSVFDVLPEQHASADQRAVSPAKATNVAFTEATQLTNTQAPNNQLENPVSTWLPVSLSIFAVIWLIGTVYCLCLLVRGLLLVDRLRKSVVEVSDERTIGLFREVVRHFNCPAPALGESKFAPAPLTIGLRRLNIVFPTGLCDQLNDEQLKSVLTHELAHVIRRDNQSTLVQHIAASLFWWNPLLHKIHRSATLLREKICDDYVVHSLGNGRAFAEALVAVAEWCVFGPPQLPATATLLVKADEIPSRLHRLADTSQVPVIRLRRKGVLANLALILTICTILLVPVFRSKSTQAGLENGQTPSQLSTGSIEQKRPSTSGKPTPQKTAENNPASETRKLVAHAFGKDVFVDQITPDETPKYVDLPVATLAKIRGQRLHDLIARMATSDYVRREKIEVPAAWKQQVLESIQNQELSTTGSLTLEQKHGLVAEIRIARLKDWLIAKSLHERYFLGRVGFGSQGNVLAVDGRNQLIIEGFANKTIRVFDPHTELAMWAAAEKRNGVDIFIERSRLAQYFASPPHQRKSDPKPVSISELDHLPAFFGGTTTIMNLKDDLRSDKNAKQILETEVSKLLKAHPQYKNRIHSAAAYAYWFANTKVFADDVIRHAEKALPFERGARERSQLFKYRINATEAKDEKEDASEWCLRGWAELPPSSLPKPAAQKGLVGTIIGFRNADQIQANKRDQDQAYYEDFFVQALQRLNNLPQKIDGRNQLKQRATEMFRNTALVDDLMQAVTSKLQATKRHTWFLEFETQSAETYGRQLDFFDIKPAFVTNDSVTFYSNFTNKPATIRTVPAKEIDRRDRKLFLRNFNYKMTCKLIDMTSPHSRSYPHTHFVSPGLADTLLKLEIEAAKGHPEQSVRRTYFEVKTSGERHEINVKKQLFFPWKKRLPANDTGVNATLSDHTNSDTMK